MTAGRVQHSINKRGLIQQEKVPCTNPGYYVDHSGEMRLEFRIKSSIDCFVAVCFGLIVIYEKIKSSR